MKRVALLSLLLGLWAAPSLSAHPELLAAITEALERDPENIPLLTEKTQTLIDMEIYDEAEETLKFIEQLEGGKSAISTYQRILLHFMKKEKERALEMSNWSVTEFPNSFIIWDMRGQLFNEDGKISEAIEAYSKGLELNEEASSGYYMRLASLMLERDAAGDPENALEIIQEAVTELGPNSGLLQFRMRLNRDLENYDEALADIDKLEEKFGFQMNFITDRAKVLILAGRNEEAIGAYERGISHIDADPANEKKKYMQRMKAKLEDAKNKLQPSMAKKP